MAANPSIQLGTDGNWAIKEDNLLAYKKDGNRFFNKEFDFSRGSLATFVGENGLIQESATNTPRIDFKNNASGHLLLEPQRTNLIINSENFEGTNWTDFSVTLTSGQSSPDGNNNAYLVEPIDSIFLLFAISTVNPSTEYTFSYFFKEGTKDTVKIAFYNDTASTFITLDATQSFIDYGNGWKRIITNVTTPSGCTSLFSYIDRSSVVGTFYAWGAQLEEGSYPTSYIPTSGSAVTRSAEVCNNSGSEQDFNDSEGVLYANTKTFEHPISLNNWMSINDGSASNSIAILFETTGTIVGRCDASGSNQSFLSYNINYTDYKKVAFKYKASDFALWVDGFEVSTVSSGNAPTGLSELDFNYGAGSNNWIGNTKEIGYYDAVLTDAELEALTSYTSFTDMANELNLTIK